MSGASHVRMDHNPDNILDCKRRRCGPSIHLHVSEPMKRELGFPGDRRCAVDDERIETFGRSQGTNPNLAVLQYFGMPETDGCPSRSGYRSQPYPADEILAKIQNCFAGWGREDRAHRQLLCLPYRGTVGCSEACDAAVGACLNRPPYCARRESFTSIIRHAVEQASFNHRPVSPLPLRIRPRAYNRTVIHFHKDESNQPYPGPVEVVLAQKR